MNLSALFISFFMIGISSYGGGTAVISMIFYEIVFARNWLSPETMKQVITVAQMTPGPIAINAATFTGFTIGQLTGSIISTIAVVLPSLILLTSAFLGKKLISRYTQGKDQKYLAKLIFCMRPAVLSLLLFAGFTLARQILIKPTYWIIFSGSLLILLFVKKIHPLWILLASGICGILFLS